MKRLYFAPADEEGSASQPRSRLAVLVEMAGGQAAAAWSRKRLGEPVKRDELLRGFERALPDGSALRVQAFPIPKPQAEAVEPALTQAQAQAPEGSLESLPLFAPSGFEPYRVRAWINGRELREVVGQAAGEDARLALILLLLVGIIETIWGARLYALAAPTRFLLTGPVFLLGALGVWKKWQWSVHLALVVAVADTIIFVARTAGEKGAGVFFLTVVARVLLISALWRLRQSGQSSG